MKVVLNGNLFLFFSSYLVNDLPLYALSRQHTNLMKENDILNTF